MVHVIPYQFLRFQNHHLFSQEPLVVRSYSCLLKGNNMIAILHVILFLEIDEVERAQNDGHPLYKQLLLLDYQCQLLLQK